ncbi:3-deoxy-manno-octulosonate cytidylyltransferase [Pontivivens insulae]|uniref:3-deoxy-manno-octulosonate cytidylyltransferase n=1 Tax=Pontivivens insulae TaxID=1639689 RepID=A0A2R8A8B8_9RHOB|nr:manno-octulosonate cytidylyltransferase [Pontivivens insulae]RED18497.1 3-deoxy-manno-octulosonate cytidylyltransferase (CMP-KDO synthetase) [Pontivivens insulae]SPF28395.1 3-deoxy-manno-octulosonate cytidylyltransferase [Pontivivens insulae]
MTDVLIVIPARYASTRYPGKPLVELTGAGGESKSLIRRSWDAAMSVDIEADVVVATDDDRIKDHAERFGAKVVMTAESCRNGTERCADVLGRIDHQPGIVVNLQGDAPLTPAWFISDLVAGLEANPDAAVATPVLRTDADALRGFKEDRKNDRVGGTTAVFDQTGRALYFSKEVLPYTGRDFAEGEENPVFHHVGVYAYRPDALSRYAQLPEGRLEKWEGLEQLRFMEHGLHVQCVEVEARGRAFWELNNPVDVARIEAILSAQGLD